MVFGGRARQTSKLVDVPESVANEVTGLLVKPNSAEALASGLCRLLADSNLRGRMSVAVRARALTLFSWQAITDRVTQVYGRGKTPHGSPVPDPCTESVQPESHNQQVGVIAGHSK